jgi:hypothetical protein
VSVSTEKRPLCSLKRAPPWLCLVKWCNFVGVAPVDRFEVVVVSYSDGWLQRHQHRGGPCSMERGNSGDGDGSDRSLFIDSRLKYRRAVSHSSFCSANRAPVSRIAAFGVGKMPTTSV